MSRTADKTLVMQLALDSDRSNPKHDRAVQYLSQPEVMHKLISAMQISKGAEIDFEKCTSEPEVPVCKGEGQYKSWIGFMDLMYRISVYVMRQPQMRDWSKGGAVINVGEPERDYLTRYLFIEVKITREPISQVIRQINLYREFVGRDKPFFLVSDYDISENEFEQLKNAGINHLRLGDDFNQFRECGADRGIHKSESI